MSKKTTYLIGILATLIIGFLLHWYLCCDENCKGKSHVEKTQNTKTTTSTPFRFEDGDTTIRSNDNFNFYFSGHAIMQPISEDLLSCVNEMIRHLEKNKNKTLNITGLYKEQEENLSNFDNLGLARAKSIKRVLIEQGLNAAQVSTTSKKDNSLTPNQEGVLKGPYAFSVEALEGSNSLEAMKASIMENPVLVNFAPERYQDVLNAKQRERLKTLADYLNASEDAKCKLSIANNKFLLITVVKYPPRPAPRPAITPQLEKNITFASAKFSFLTTFGKAASEVGMYGEPTTDSNPNENKINATFSVVTA